jgi:hypothetical protein
MRRSAAVVLLRIELLLLSLMILAVERFGPASVIIRTVEQNMCRRRDDRVPINKSFDGRLVVFPSYGKEWCGRFGAMYFLLLQGD